MRRPRSTNPALLAIVGEGFVSRLSFGMVAFALPLYARELGMSLTAIGLLASLNMMVALALKPLMGILADRIGLRLGLSTAIVARSAVTALFAVAAAPWHLFGARALHGVSIALRDPSVNALIAEHGGKKAIAQSFAWYQTAKSVGGSLSKAAAGVLITLTAANFSIVFLVAFALSLAPVLVVLRYVREPDRPAHSEAVEAASSQERAGEDDSAEASPQPAAPRPPVLRYAGAGFLIGSSTHMLNTFFPILATEYAGLSAAQAGGLYTIGAVAALAGPAFGWLSDNVSRALVLQLRSAANIVSSVLYLVSPSLVGFAAGRLLDDLGKAAFKPAWGSMMAHVSSYDRRRRAQIMGTISSGEDAGELAGPLLAGFLWATGGVGILLGGRIVLAVCAEAYMAALGHGGADDRGAAVAMPRAPAARARARLAAHRRGIIAVPSTLAAVAGLWISGVFDSTSDAPEGHLPAGSAASLDATSLGALVDARLREAAQSAAPRPVQQPAAARPAKQRAPRRRRQAPRIEVRPSPPAAPVPSPKKPAAQRPTPTQADPIPTPPADAPGQQPPSPEPTTTPPASPPTPTPTEPPAPTPPPTTTEPPAPTPPPTTTEPPAPTPPPGG